MSFVHPLLDGIHSHLALHYFAAGVWWYPSFFMIKFYRNDIDSWIFHDCESVQDAVSALQIVPPSYLLRRLMCVPAIVWCLLYSVIPPPHIDIVIVICVALKSQFLSLRTIPSFLAHIRSFPSHCTLLSDGCLMIPVIWYSSHSFKCY